MDSVIDILARLVSLPSVNPMGADADLDICFEGRVSDWLEEFFRETGAEFERIPVAPGRDNLVARFHSSSAWVASRSMDSTPSSRVFAGSTNHARFFR